ncbi:MAG TPA: hypothetical protein GXX18_18285 [Bacillales bacterium]|nr:hypothetical protein [Bacillales bacterium]
MVKITNKGRVWEVRNSLWMLWAILTFGLLNYVSFFYVSYKVRQRKWFIAGLIYSILFILVMTATELPEDHWFYNAALFTYIIGWIVSIVHVFKIRTEYLLRLEAKLLSGPSEIQSLKRQIAREYAQANSERADHSFSKPIKNVLDTETTNQNEGIQGNYSEGNVIDINKATEEEVAKVPGIGTLFAKKVISIREEVGGYKSFSHFVEVLSVKPHLVEKIKPYLHFPEEAVPQQMKKYEGRIVDF